MKIWMRKSLAFLLIILLIAGQVPSYGAIPQIDEAIKDTANYIYKTVKDPQVGSIGGEWAIIGLARSEADIADSYYSNYYKNVENYVKEAKGILHDKKYTEYSRLILGLTAAGYDPTDVAGYDLTKALGDFEKTIWQGINGPIFALIALDSGNYPMSENREAQIQASRSMYVDEILSRQLSDGGFSLFGGIEGGKEYKSDPDITAMALQALAKYQDREDVKKVTEEALASLSKLQNNKGGYSSWGEENSESVAQVIVALGEQGIPLDDSRFVKNGNTLLDNLMDFYIKNQGFSHTINGGSNLMATEQAFYALVAADRLEKGKNSLYRMGDAIKNSKEDSETELGIGLVGKNPDVEPKPIILLGRTFDDISGANPHKNLPAIEDLASRGIINGKTENLFDPDATMTRAEFATIVVNSLGLEPKTNNKFADVLADEWFSPYVGTANNYGIVKGISHTRFNPQGTITRQEAGAMVARAAKLCGMETEMDTGAIRDVLAQFTDYLKVAEWARSSLAFCYQENILDQSEIEIQANSSVLRSEVAQMLFNMLESANLL